MNRAEMSKTIADARRSFKESTRSMLKEYVFSEDELDELAGVESMELRGNRVEVSLCPYTVRDSLNSSFAEEEGEALSKIREHMVPEMTASLNDVLGDQGVEIDTSLPGDFHEADKFTLVFSVIKTEVSAALDNMFPSIENMPKIRKTYESTRGLRTLRRSDVEDLEREGNSVKIYDRRGLVVVNGKDRYRLVEGKTGSYKVVAVLPDGQRFDDEAHVGEYHSGGMSKDEADNAVYNLDMDRPDGFDDVEFEVEKESTRSRVTGAVSGNDGRIVKIYKDSDTGEFICKLFVKGKHNTKDDYFTDDKTDAIKTANEMVKESCSRKHPLTESASSPINFNGLEWQVGPDQDTTWDEAKAWVDGLGGDWRMPTPEELRGLWDAGISRDNWGPFENSGWRVWSSEVRDSSSAWNTTFNTGPEPWDLRDTSYGVRGFAVRDPKGSGGKTESRRRRPVKEATSSPINFNGLEWQVGPDQDTNWDAANTWVDSLGDGWRMPTVAELQGLWDAGIKYGKWGPFGNSGYWVWSGQVRDSSSAWLFYFYGGYGSWGSRRRSGYGRAFAVRIPNGSGGKTTESRRRRPVKESTFPLEEGTGTVQQMPDGTFHAVYRKDGRTHRNYEHKTYDSARRTVERAGVKFVEGNRPGQ